jgi:DNA-binding NarL/FixJ family response regulator
LTYGATSSRERQDGSHLPARGRQRAAPGSAGSAARAEGIEIVGKASTGLEAIALLQSCAPGAILLDLRLPDLSGLAVARLAAETAPDTAVILYTSHADWTLVRKALDAGARGVVRKHASPANLLRAIRAIAAGDIFIDPQLVPESRLGRAHILQKEY